MTRNLQLVGGTSEAPAPTDLPGLFERFAPYVARIGQRLLGRIDDVNDLVQDVFLAAHRGMEDIRDPAAVRGWLSAVTVRLAYKRLRRRYMWAKIGLGDRGFEPDEQLGPSLAPEQQIQLRMLYAALDRLPPAERIAWTLRHIEQHPLAEVASLCACSLATAKRRITSAHAKLMEVLGDA